MKEMMIVLYKNNGKEIGAISMKELVNLPSYEGKTVKELIEEMGDEDISIKFQYRKVVD